MITCPLLLAPEAEVSLAGPILEAEVAPDKVLAITAAPWSEVEALDWDFCEVEFVAVEAALGVSGTST